MLKKNFKVALKIGKQGILLIENGDSATLNHCLK